MGICDPFIQVECDKCGAISDGMGLTSLAGGGWDDRNIKYRIKREGWLVEGQDTICPECATSKAV